MTQDEVLEIALDANIDARVGISLRNDEGAVSVIHEFLERFAALVAAAQAEADAKVCDELEQDGKCVGYCAAAIRARATGGEVGK